MNFFEHQDEAKNQTKRLVLLLIIAIIALIVVTTLFVAILLHYSQGAVLPSTELQSFWQNFFALVDWNLLLSVAAVVISVVVIGSFYRIGQLRQGGSVVAESLNGKLLNTAECDLKEKRLHHRLNRSAFLPKRVRHRHCFPGQQKYIAFCDLGMHA